MLSTVILGGVAAYLQSGVVALSSRFGTSHLQAILSGQGGIGVAVAFVQLIAAYSSLEAAESSPLHITVETPASIRRAAFGFFVAVVLFAVLAFCAHLVLCSLPLYRLVIRGSSMDTAPRHPSLPKLEPVSFRVVEKKVRKLGLAIFYVFFVTLQVFPTITGTIRSVHDPLGDNEPGGLGPTLSQRELFIPLAFAIFAAGDWAGRAMPQINMLIIKDWKILSIASIARTAFIVSLCFFYEV